MSDFTTQITNPAVIGELPDVSILNTLHRDDLTGAELQALLNSVSFRKKLQTLFEFKFSDAARDLIEADLRAAHDTFEVDQGNTVTYTNGIMFVNGRAISSDFGTFASGIFSDETFATLFISESIMDIVFGANDETFTAATLAIPKFWDRLLANDTVYQYVLTTYSEIIMASVKTTEVSYVKYISNGIGLDFTRYKHAINLAEDGSAMEAIWIDAPSKDVESDSAYGVTARLMYVFGSADIAEIENSTDAMAKITNDPALQQFVVDIDVVRQLDPASLVAKFVVDHDGRFGTMASTMLEASVALNISNIFYDNEYSDVLSAFVRNDELVAYFMGSTLYATFANRFYDAFIQTVNNVQRYAVRVTSSEELFIAYNNRSFAAKSLITALAGFTETKAGSSANITTADGMFKIPKIFSDNSIMGINLDRSIEFTNSGNELVFNEFASVKIDDVTSNGDHVFGIDQNGNIISSKFVTDLNLSTETVEQVLVYDNSAFVITAETIHSIGNIGSDTNAIRNRIIIEKDAIDTIVEAHGKILAVVAGDLKEVTNDALVGYGGLDAGIVSEIYSVDGALVIVDTAGNMFELNADLTTDAIATDVSATQQAQDGLFTKIAGADRIVFKFNDAWLTYNHIAGGVEE